MPGVTEQRVSSPSTRNGKEGGVGWGSRGLQWFKAPCIFSIWRTLLVTESPVHWAMKEPICSPPRDRLWIQLATTLQEKKSISTSRLIWYRLYLSSEKIPPVWGDADFSSRFTLNTTDHSTRPFKDFHLIKVHPTNMFNYKQTNCPNMEPSTAAAWGIVLTTCVRWI